MVDSNIKASITGALLVLFFTGIGSYVAIKVSDVRADEKMLAMVADIEEHKRLSEKEADEQQCEIKELRNEIKTSDKEKLEILRNLTDKLHSVEIMVTRVDEGLKRIESHPVVYEAASYNIVASAKEEPK